MNLPTKALTLALPLTLLAACGHTLALTSAGEHVTKVERSALPDDCHVVGDVTIGIAPDAALANTEPELLAMMRNRAGSMGADHLTVEMSELRPADSGTGPGHWVGTATAYRCAPLAEGGEGPHEAPAEGGGGAPTEDTGSGGAPPPI